MRSSRMRCGSCPLIQELQSDCSRMMSAAICCRMTSTPFGKTLLGKPVYVSDNMPEMAAGKTPIYYGDMSGLAVKMAEELEIQVLRERFATQHADGVVGWVEMDAKVENAQKIAKLTMASA